MSITISLTPLKTVLTLFAVCIITVAIGQDTRSINGFGNNADNPHWGSSHDVQQRLVLPMYADGISQLVQSRPNPRVISNVLFDQEEIIASDLSLSDFTWVFGQFIDHDIVLSESSGEPLFDIVVPEDDEDFTPGDFIFMSRNEFSPESGITTPREHINSITAYLDLSAVYGSDDETATWLRTLEDGKLKTSSGNLLPWNTIDGEFNSIQDLSAPHMEDGTGLLNKLYVAGDVRANENPLLISIHTLFMREHNRLADIEKINHPGWNDERLYQSAREKNIAAYQKIIFNEWLPVMGVNLPEYAGYNPILNPQIFNEFSAAAFRLGHTLINSNIIRMDNLGEEIKSGNITLRDAFFNPFAVELAGGIDVYLKGMATQIQQEFDCKVIDDVRNFLFGAPGEGGLDLVAININRARERGIPDYNTLRREIGMAEVSTFDQITSSADDAELLENLYENVDNIDPWVGMLAEDKENEGLFGDLVTTMMERQFQALRDGDRFYYENIGLSKEEVAEIESVTMKELLLRNTDIELMQDEVFRAIPHEDIEEGPELVAFPLKAVLYPNPVEEILQIKVYSAIDDDVKVSVFDYQGRLVKSHDIVLIPGNNFISIDADNMYRGYYNVVLETKTRRTILKMIKR